MKKHFLLLFAICNFLSITYCSAQAPNIQWQKTYGGSDYEIAQIMQPTSDGGYVLAGYTTSNDGDVTGNHGDFDVWIVKIDSAGTLTWQKTFGGSGDDRANSIQQTPDGGYIIAGVTFSNDGDVNGLHGLFFYSDFWVIKTDSMGTLQWQKCLGGTADEEAWSVGLTADGNYIVAGGCNSNDGDVSGNHGTIDCWVVKLDTAGAIIWQKCLGGSNFEEAFSIQQTSDGGYVIAGNSNSNDGDVSGNHGDWDNWIVKLDSAGAIIWQKSLGGSAFEHANSAFQTIDSDYLITGYSLSNDGDVSGNHGSADYWIVKLDTAGNIKWQKCFGGTQGENPGSTLQTPDSGYIVAGLSSSNDGDVSGNHGDFDVWVVKLSPDGTTGVNDASNDGGLSVYPNPFNEELIVNCEKLIGRKAEIKLYDIYSRNVLSQSLTTVNSKLLPTRIGTANLSNGIYIYEVRDKSGIIKKGKVVKE